jgi:thiamine biosynthesis lipoprotein
MSSPCPTVDASSTLFGVANWRALGTYVQLVVAGAEHLQTARATAVRLLDDVDRTCSRFRDDSDLTRANRSAGSWTRVDPMLAAAVSAAVRAAEQTGGLVDPTMGLSLAAAGYDRDFDAVRISDGPASIPVPALPDAWRQIEVDPDGAVRVPVGVSLDLGATGKAFAADLVATAVATQVGAGCVLSLGGDVAVGVPDGPGVPAGPEVPSGDSLRVGGRAQAPVPWRVAISEVPDSEPDATVVLPTGGLATSTVLARRWQRGGRVVHHLLDPATGRPVTRTWRTASVAAPTCLAANTASTAAILLGAAAPAWLDRFGVTARLVDEQGDLTFVGDWLEEED